LAPPNLASQSRVSYLAAKPAGIRLNQGLAGIASENRSTYHRTVVPIAFGDVLSFEASLKTADAAMTRANNAIIAAISIDLGSRRRLSEFLCMNRAPAADASG
jgi:hypothetical protein